ncbi:hypothetical protein LCGC14_2661080, partial [marine sediment metagenome]
MRKPKQYEQAPLKKRDGKKESVYPLSTVTPFT